MDNTYYVPPEGFGYYMDAEEKEKAQQFAYAQYVQNLKTERLIKKITALVSSVLLAQSKGYFSDELGRDKNNNRNNNNNGQTDQQNNVSGATQTHK